MVKKPAKSNVPRLCRTTQTWLRPFRLERTALRPFCTDGETDTHTMTSIAIRQESEKDFSAIRDIIRQAFANNEESDHTEHLLVERLRRSETYVPGLALVAETSEQLIVGHIMMSEIEVVAENKTYTALALAPLSVKPEYQGMGIGGTLVRAAHDRAEKSGYGAALLLGHKDFYPKFGYKKASSFGIKFPFDAPEECCMAVELKKGSLRGIHGTVHYPPAFQIPENPAEQSMTE